MHFMSSAWWIGDKGKKLVEEASSMLTPEWQHLMNWPRMTVGIQDDLCILSREGP